MKTKSKLIATALCSSVFLNSCVSNRIPPDLKASSVEISQRTYVLHQYDCSNMSFDLTVKLRELGYDARIYCYRTKDYGHAIVEVILPGRTIYLDPTMGPLKYRVPKPNYEATLLFTPSQIHNMKSEFFNIRMVWEMVGHLKP